MLDYLVKTILQKHILEICRGIVTHISIHNSPLDVLKM